MHLSKGISDKLQSENLDVVSGCERVIDLPAAIKVLLCEAKFELFWKSILERCCELGITEPKEDHPHKLPRQIEDNPQTAVHMSAKDKLRVSFYYNVVTWSSRCVFQFYLLPCNKFASLI
jgi:hypothetical protein